MNKVESYLNKDVYLKALAYAHRKLNKFKDSNLSINFLNAEDLVHTAVVKTLSGEREWNIEKTPDLFVHLAGCIKSNISNSYRSYEANKVDRRDDLDEIMFSHVKNYSPDENIEIKSKIEFLIDYIGSKRGDLVRLAELMYKEGISNPSEIKDELGISIKEANVQKVAIKRILKRSDFLISYISNNRKELSDTAIAIYEKKIAEAKGLSEELGVEINQAEKLRKEVLSLGNEISQGNF